MQYWLMKSEADNYSIDDLEKDKKTLWTGIRNYQARNFMREMQVDDKVLFYHSNGGDKTGVVGEATVSKQVIPDPTQFDQQSDYYDPNTSPDNPRWECVEIAHAVTYDNPVSLRELKAKKQYHDMVVVRPGNRLSITPVSQKHFNLIHSAGV